jgi:hypothetical protein
MRGARSPPDFTTSVPSRFRASRGFRLGLLLLLAASCDDPAGSVPSEAVGTYALTRVNGQPLPVRITDTPDQQVDIVLGRMIVRADGSYRESRDSRVTDAQGTRTGTSFTEGTLEVSGSSLEVRERVGGTYTGTWGDGSLSYSIPTGPAVVTFTYEKE